MKVAVRNLLLDGVTEQVRVEEYDSTQDVSETLPFLKTNAFVLLEHFLKTVPCANIDGVFHIFDSQKNIYRPFAKKELEEFLITRYYRAISLSGSLRVVKECVELIIRHTYKEEQSAEKRQLLCFPNGFLSLANIEQINFFPYSYPVYNARPIDTINYIYPPFNPYPTYQINCSNFPIASTWEAMKDLPTPHMDSFLRTCAYGTPNFEKRAWEMLGYLLSPDRNGKCFFVLQGLPNSGKSIFGRLIQELLPDYKIANLDVDQLNKKKATKRLVNKCINISMDLPNKPIAPPTIRSIKLITGNDTLTIEHENGDFETYKGNCTFLFATNHAITLRGSDSGFEERLVCIPFRYSVPHKHRNPYLLELLLKEKDYIVAKALAYYRDLRNNGYVFSGSEYELFKPKVRYLPTEAEDMDAGLCDFIDNRCEFVSQENGIHTEDLYNAYRQYCKDYNETPIDNANSFSRRLMRCYGDRLVKEKWRKPGEQNPKWGFKGILFQAMREVKIYNV